VRKQRLIDCDPQWFNDTAEVSRYLHFECPEGHEGCAHTIPFTPALDGTVLPSPQVNGALWARTGDTFETLTLSPSIKRIPRYTDREAALTAGCLEEHLPPTMFCALHIHIVDGAIVFCDDSK